MLHSDVPWGSRVTRATFCHSRVPWGVRDRRYCTSRPWSRWGEKTGQSRWHSTWLWSPGIIQTGNTHDACQSRSNTVEIAAQTATYSSIQSTLLWTVNWRTTQHCFYIKVNSLCKSGNKMVDKQETQIVQQHLHSWIRGNNLCINSWVASKTTLHGYFPCTKNCHKRWIKMWAQQHHQDAIQNGWITFWRIRTMRFQSTWRWAVSQRSM